MTDKSIFGWERGVNARKKPTSVRALAGCPLTSLRASQGSFALDVEPDQLPAAKG